MFARDFRLSDSAARRRRNASAAPQGVAVLCLQVTVVNGSGVELCDGVLLSPSSVLTAASCLYQEQDINNIFVVLGTSPFVNKTRFLGCR